PKTTRALDRIPQLMHKLNKRAGSVGLVPSYRDQYLTQQEHQKAPGEASYSTAAGSPTHRDPPYDIGEYLVSKTAPPAPPPRALELVKEEVHRALEAFSARPLKGQSDSPLPSDLLRPFDVSKDGLVTYREFQTGILGLGIGLTAQETEALTRTVDEEGTGLVDRGKFEAQMTQDWGRSGDCKKTTSAAGFATFSAARDGAVCSDEDAPRSQNGCANQETSFLRPEEEQHQARHQPRPNDGTGARDSQTRFFSGEELLPPPPQSSKIPKPLRSDSTPETTTKGSSACGPPVVSFDHWQRHRTAARKRDSSENGSDAAAPTASIPARAKASISTSSRSKGRGEKSRSAKASNNEQNLHPSLEHLSSLDTLRSLLRQDGVFDDKAMAMANRTDDVSRRPSSFLGTSKDRESGGKRRQEQNQDRCQHQSCQVNEVNLRSSGRSDGGGDCRRRGDLSMAKNNNLLEVLRRDASSSSLSPRGASVGCNFAGGRRGNDRPGTCVPVSTAEILQNLEKRGSAIAARAESVLRLRSRGDLVGLRRAVSKADPSASGVVSQREMERAVLRRFGAGLGDDEARELATRYRRDFNGRSMVDYGRLFDSLEAKEAGLLGQPMPSSSSPSSYSGRGRGWGRRREGQQQQRLFSRNSEGGRRARPASMEVVKGGQRRGSSSMPAAAGARNRYSQRRYSRRGALDCDNNYNGCIGGDVPAEESQLVRRARAKTLALLDRHGTRSFESIFRLVDPAHTQSVTSRKLRKGLRMLGGTDTLSEVEHRALFRDVSKGRDRIKYRELLDTLRMAEAAENRERTHRKLACQAELPTSGRGSASHWRHSDVLDWDVPPAGGGSTEDTCAVGLTGGRQHKESRRQALVFDKLRNSVRQIQEQRDSAGPVLDMFYREGKSNGQDDGGTTSTPGGSDAISRRDDRHTPPALSPSALRAGLGSLGVPLGDEDFVTLIATADPDRRGVVSYPSFCEALNLHEIRGDLLDDGRPATLIEQQRLCSMPPPPPPPSLRQSEGQYWGVSAVSTAAGAGNRGREGGGYTRRRAMELAPPADTQRDLEGGVFHANPATQGCLNPNFTTTMMPVSSRGPGGAHPSPVEAYRPKRRQSPAPAPGGILTGVRARSHGQTLLVVGDGGDHVDLRGETGAEAERQFRQGLGVKMRRSQSLSSCYTRGRRGWDNLGTPSARGIAPSPQASSSSVTESRAAWSGAGITGTCVFTGGSGNRRNRGHTPRDNDLGFGSERMRCRSRCHDDEDRSIRGRSHCSEAEDGSNMDAGLRRARSLSLGAERRYGDWARSSVKHLLQQDSWLGIRSSYPARTSPATHPPNKIERRLSEPRGGGAATDRQANRAAAGTTLETNRCPSSLPGASQRREYCNTPVTRNNSRHPAQTRERRPTPYATDADYSSVRRVMPVEADPSRSAADRGPRVTMRDRKGANGVDGSGGGGGGGEFSPTLRWGEAVSFPPKRSRGHKNNTSGHAAMSSGLKKSRGRKLK
ncbi:unnamed protein product, partial [Hapterophycus canaliculatus]